MEATQRSSERASKRALLCYLLASSVLSNARYILSERRRPCVLVSYRVRPPGAQLSLREEERPLVCPIRLELARGVLYRSEEYVS